MTSFTHDRLNMMASALEVYLKDKGISQRALAQKIGINSSYITHALAKNWDKVPVGGGRSSKFSDQIAKKICTFLGIGVRVWETDNFDAVTVILLEAKQYSEHRIIDGEKGTGKSFACNEFKKQYPAETYLMTCSEDMNPKAFMLALAEMVGVEQTGDRRKLRVAIGEKIKKMATPVIIIDEAENLKPATYGSIKALYDDVKDYCGIVLVGANDYLEGLRKKANSKRGCFPQIYSRFSADPAQLQTISQDDVKYVCHLNDITDPSVIKAIWNSVSDYRELDRKVKRIIRDNKLKEAA